MTQISIIVPVYNSAACLRQCIDSILIQSLSDFELLLVDDGSTDGSASICDEYSCKDSRIRVFHKENSGVGATRNFGMRMAKSPWITFIDSDDWIDREYLASFHSGIDENVFTLQGINYFYPIAGGEKIFFSYPEKEICISETTELKAIDLFANGCPVAKLFSRKIIEDNGLKFSESISLNEDHIFVISYYSYVKRIHLCAHNGYYYRKEYSERTLTSKFHSAQEYLLISDTISASFLSLCKKLDVKPKDVCCENTRYILGLIQIIHALRTSAASTDRRKLFDEIIEHYARLDDTLKRCAMDFYGRTLTRLLDMGCRNSAYAYLIAHYIKHSIVCRIR